MVIFVHGCFWHRHPGCRMAYSPKSNKRFWNTKFAENVARDRRARRQLKKLGWNVAVAWECQVKTNPEATVNRIVRQMGVHASAGAHSSA
jgi:DNA mismatch endonuclease (patch repair protein)